MFTIVRQDKDITIIILVIILISVSMIYEKILAYRRAEYVKETKMRLLQEQVDLLIAEKSKLLEDLIKIKANSASALNLKPVALNNDAFVSSLASDAVTLVCFLVIGFYLFAYIYDMTSKFKKLERVNNLLTYDIKDNIKAVEKLDAKVSIVLSHLEENTDNPSIIGESVSQWLINRNRVENVVDSTLRASDPNIVEIVNKLELVEVEIQKLNDKLIELGSNTVSTAPPSADVGVNTILSNVPLFSEAVDFITALGSNPPPIV